MEYLSNDLAVSRDHMILGDLGLSQPNSDYGVNAMDVCLSEGNTSNQNKTIVIGLSVVVFLQSIQVISLSGSATKTRPSSM